MAHAAGMNERHDRLPRETPLSGPDAEPEDKRRELAGDEPTGEQTAYLERDELDRGPEHTSTEIYEGELEPNVAETGGLESLTEQRGREGETDDPSVAAEEGKTWVPPTDPPVVPSADRQDAEIAAGFGESAISEPYDQHHATTTLAQEDELSARVREGLRADAATTRYADELAIGTRGGTVAVRGVVDDVEDSDNVVEVASRVSGVDQVVDELDVRGL